MSEGPIRILALFGGVTYFGQERGNVEALVALQNAGCDVLCLVRDEKHASRVCEELDARGLAWRKSPYINITSVRSRFGLVVENVLRFIPANWTFLKVWLNFRPTHIHAFNQLYVLNFILALSCVATPMIYRAGDEPVLHNAIWRTVWRFVVSRTSHFVANSQFVTRLLVASGASPNKISVIYNTPPYRNRATLAPFIRPRPAGARFVAYVGQISAQKGVHFLVEAFRELADDFPDTHLLIAGTILDEWRGDAWARDLRERTGNDARLSGRVSFLGEVDSVPQLLEMSEFLITPSVGSEASPNVVIEAKTAGRASIVFPTGGLPELVAHEEEGLVCEEPDARALAQCMRTYFHRPDLARQHGAAARRSLDRLGIGLFQQKWRDVYVRTMPSASCGRTERDEAQLGSHS